MKLQTIKQIVDNAFEEAKEEETLDAFGDRLHGIADRLEDKDNLISGNYEEEKKSYDNKHSFLKDDIEAFFQVSRQFSSVVRHKPIVSFIRNTAHLAKTLYFTRETQREGVQRWLKESRAIG